MIPERRRAAVVAVGDELLEGRFADTNSGVVARALADLGIEVVRCVVLGDDARELERAFYELARDYPIVIVTGGLGPTLDDVTREAAARAAGVRLVRDEGVFAGLVEWFARRGREMPASNVRQAEFPEGAQVMPNRCGTAPGFRVWIEGGMLAVLPGPPIEMRDMLERELVPWLASTCGQSEFFSLAQFYLVGLPESAFADRVGDWMDREANPRIGVTAHQGVLAVSLRAHARTADAARRRIEERSAEFRRRFAHEIFSESEARLAFVVGERAIERGVTLALAESCTGGMVAEMLTDVPGISAVFREGFVTYAHEAKIARQGVPPSVIEEHGAVSRATAEAMALGAARASGAELAVSTTGIAGPGGSSPDKPVGLVWFGLARGERVSSRELRFPPVDRASVRRFAAHAALELLWRELAH
jgi:nicotinamide-nucleotide amidase